MACFLLFIPEYALDFLLGGDGGVVGAGNPECSFAFHTMISHQNIFNRKHGGVPQMEGSGDVRWRKNDGKRFGIRINKAFFRADIGIKKSACFPYSIDGVLVVFGFVGCGDFRFHMGKW